MTQNAISDPAAYKCGRYYEDLKKIQHDAASHEGGRIIHDAAQGRVTAILGLDKKGKTTLAQFIELAAKRDKLEEVTGLWNGLMDSFVRDGEHTACPMSISYRTGNLRCMKAFQKGTPYREIISWFGQAFELDPATDLAGRPLPWEPAWEDENESEEEKNG